MRSTTKRFAILAMAALAFFNLPCFATEELLPPPAERGPFSGLVGDEPNLLQETCPEDLRETGLRLLARVHRTEDHSRARLWLDQVQGILSQCRPIRVDALEQNLRSACPTSVVEEWLPMLEEVRKTDTRNSWLSARSEIDPVIKGCREVIWERASVVVGDKRNLLQETCPEDLRETGLRLLVRVHRTKDFFRARLWMDQVQEILRQCRARQADVLEEKRRSEAERRAEEQRRERVQEIERTAARLAELRAEREELEAKLAAELERQARLKEYCDNGHLYFTKTLFGFGDWVEIDESTGITVAIKEFDLNNAVRNRLLELEAAGWKGKIPAKTVACGPGVQAIHEVLR